MDEFNMLWLYNIEFVYYLTYLLFLHAQQAHFDQCNEWQNSQSLYQYHIAQLDNQTSNCVLIANATIGDSFPLFFLKSDES